MSIDALRGFDMFWIIGIEGSRGVARAIRQISENPAVDFVVRQLSHSQWEGFTFCDLIFPLFVFLTGLSIPLSLARIIRQSGIGAAHLRIARRFVVLYGLGVFYYGGLSRAWPDVRLVGVLQRIAFCYLFVSLIFCHFRLKGMILICATVLIGYWALMTFVPVPGIGAGCLEEGRNVASYVDEHYLPGRRINGTWDPEGLLSTLPAVGTCLLGVFSGMLLKAQSMGERKKLVILVVAGMAGVALGFSWGLQFPVIKKLWTSSYVLVAGGYSCLLLAFFYLVIDVWQLRKWAQPFVWIGMNALALYLAYQIIDFRGLAMRLVGGNMKAWAGRYGDLLVCLVAVGLCLCVARFLYKRKVFLRA
jgi:predicted acyltransferase